MNKSRAWFYWRLMVITSEVALVVLIVRRAYR